MGTERPGEASDPVEGIGLAETITRFSDRTETLITPRFSRNTAITDLGDETPLLQRPPSRAGEHIIVRLLGAGGMGSVFEARAPDGTLVALKFIGDASPERLYRFKREFRTLSAIVHPNLVELYELLQAKGDDGSVNVFFTMERLHGEHFVAAVRPGCAIHQALDDEGLRRLQHGLVGLASGLSCVHRHGLVHRDVKPSNVMITDIGRVVLLDLGLVREVKTASFDNASVVGTPLYMAPEQIVSSNDVGPAADWYAVGEVLWESLTGAPRHSGSVYEVLERKLSMQPVAPSTLGIAVPPELDALCLDLLARDPAARPSARDVLVRLGRGDLVAIEVVTRGLIGRAGEAEALRRSIARARGGRPSVAIISGLSGFGKTTVVEHVVDLVHREDGLVCFTGHCSERESIPFKALDTAMDELAVHLCNQPVELDHLEDIAALARLFPVLRSVPEIRALAASSAHDADPVQTRRRAADALAGLLTAVAAERPLVLVLDNLQWADLDSVQLLESVLLRPQAPPLALLCSFHEGAEASRLPLARLLASLGAAEPIQIEKVAIGPFSEAQSSVLAAHLLGLEPADPLAARIAREAQGSPFFIGELARHARTSGGLTDSVTTLNLDDVIRLRMRGLPAAARRLIEVLAIAGGRLPRAVAIKVVEATTGALDRGTIARLRAEHLIRAESSDDGALETYHDRIRAAVARDAQDADKPALQAIHRAIAEALLATERADKATLAHHLREAGDTTRASRFTLDAAEEASALLAFERAAELFAAVLALGGLTPAEATRVRVRLAQSLADSGQLYAAANMYREAAAAPEGPTPAERTEWLRLATVHLLATGHHDEGRATLEVLLPRVGLKMTGGTASTIARLLGARALLKLRKLELPRGARPRLSEAEIQRLDVCWTATRGLIYCDGIRSSLFHARHLDLALSSGDLLRTARAIAFEAYLGVLTDGGRADAHSRKVFTALLAEPEVQANPYAFGMITQFWASCQYMLCRFTDGVRDSEKGAEILRSQCSGELHEVAQILAHRALMLMYLGRVADVAAAASAILHECAARPNPYVEGFAHGLLGYVVSLGADRIDDAVEHMAAYRRDAPKRFEVHFFNWSCERTELERYRGEYERSWALHQEDAQVIKKMIFLRTPWVMTEYQRGRGCSALGAATRRREPAELLAIARASAKVCLKQPLINAEGHGRLILAGVAALVGDQDTAVAELRRVITVFERCEMAGYLAATRRRLAALVGGDEGRALMRLADVWIDAEKIVRPDRYTNMMAPGFVSEI
jgi:hypothetical protein